MSVNVMFFSQYIQKLLAEFSNKLEIVFSGAEEPSHSVWKHFDHIDTCSKEYCAVSDCVDMYFHKGQGTTRAISLIQEV